VSQVLSILTTSDAELAARIAAAAANLPRDLVRARNRRNLSLRETGEQVGLSHVTIRNVELGEPVSVPTLVALLRWLDGGA
jgi:hypothetical protein